MLCIYSEFILFIQFTFLHSYHAKTFLPFCKNLFARLYPIFALIEHKKLFSKMYVNSTEPFFGIIFASIGKFLGTLNLEISFQMKVGLKRHCASPTFKVNEAQHIPSSLSLKHNISILIKSFGIHIHILQCTSMFFFYVKSCAEYS